MKQIHVWLAACFVLTGSACGSDDASSPSSGGSGGSPDAGVDATNDTGGGSGASGETGGVVT